MSRVPSCLCEELLRVPSQGVSDGAKYFWCMVGSGMGEVGGGGGGEGGYFL